MSVDVSLPAVHEMGTLLEPEFHKPGGLRRHKEASKKLREENKVKGKATAKVDVNILEASHKYALIGTLHQQLRAIIVRWCFVWDRGVWYLPNANYTRCWEELNPVLEKVEEAHAGFLADYDHLKILWEERGGDLAHGFPFPSKEELSRKLWVAIKPGIPVDPDDVRCGGLNAEQREHFEKETRKNEQRRYSGCVDQLRDKTLKRCEHAIEALKNEKGKESDSMLEHFRFLADQLGDMNITHDPVVEEVRERLLKNICPLDSETLRATPELRKKTGKTLEDIKGRLGAFGKSRS